MHKLLLALSACLLLSVSAGAQRQSRKNPPPASTCAVTPGLLTTVLPNGHILVYGRLAMDYPSGNEAAHYIRQIQITVPLMENDTAVSPTGAPLVQATTETGGSGNAPPMLIYQTSRDELNGCFRLIFNAITPGGQMQPTDAQYFLNLTVIGQPLSIAPPKH